MSEEALAAAWREPGARILTVRGQDVPIVEDDRGPRLALDATSGEYALEGPPDSDGRPGPLQHLFLGRVAGDPMFATAAAEGAESGSDGESDVAWVHPFEVGGSLSDAERELIAIASALIRWHEAAGFSPRDGGPTRPVQGGWARLDERGGELFPRTDPAVIVLIEHEDRVLLGSNALWQPDRFSLLAGFVEAGESLEEAVRREVFEESGVRLGEVEYVTSQPWPFPRSLMLGFRARLAEGVDPGHLVPAPDEISELRWFTRDELREPRAPLTLPRSLSIAGWMLAKWLKEDLAGDARG
ncbi:NAD(+) diphosphatase [Leucobacter zeae]|nr:NAD(+) diphosphatase [Leucobacter zeae]